MPARKQSFFGVFTFFNSEIFFSKILEHASKDAEFYGDSCSMFEISGERLLKNFYNFFVL